MAEQHRATADEWALIERMLHCVEFSCLLELRDRIKALEARNENDKEAWAAMRRAGSSHGERIGALMERIEDLENDRRAILNSSSRLRLGLDAAQPAKPDHPAKPDSSLVKRVADAIVAEAKFAGVVNDRPARATIREVAAWMRENPDVYFPPDLVFTLEQEAER